jgi:peptidoglycan/xylan/chitin deacetylase (PgdA/CDA1 family)
LSSGKEAYMSIPRTRIVALVSIVLAMTAVGPAPAVAAPSPPAPPGEPKQAGPWPPERVLAADPDSVAAPKAAVSTTSCPVPPYGVQRSAPGAGRTVALTFDDGPGPSTPEILNILQRYGIPATFFNIGINATSRPGPVRAQAALGYALGNHTWSHPSMPTLSASAQGTEMDRTNATQASQVNQPACVFRPPYGEYNTATLDAAYQRRMAVWNWSVDTEDWKAEGATQFWIDRIVSLAQAGGSQQHPVVLMHNQPTGNPATVAALPRIIEYYRSLGYTFVDLNGHAGITYPGPATAVTSGGLQTFVRGTDAALYRRIRTGGTWSAPIVLGGGMYDGPAAVAVNATTTEVFIHGLDNHIWTRTVTDSGGGSGWTDLGGLLTSRPAVTVSAGGVLTVVARGGDGSAWMRERTGGTWGAWQSIGGIFSSPLTAATTPAGGIFVAGLGGNGEVWLRNRTTAWSAWRSVGGLGTAEPALSATSGGGGVAVVMRGGNNAYWLRVGNATGTSWGAWTTLGGAFTSAPAMVVDGAQIDAFGYGGNGRLYLSVAANGAAASGWSAWQELP